MTGNKWDTTMNHDGFVCVCQAHVWQEPANDIVHNAVNTMVTLQQNEARIPPTQDPVRSDQMVRRTKTVAHNDSPLKT